MSSKLFTDYVRQSKYITPRLQRYFLKDRDSQDIMLFVLALALCAIVGTTAHFMGVEGFFSSALAAVAPIFLWGDVQGRRMAAGIIYRREKNNG